MTNRRIFLKLGVAASLSPLLPPEIFVEELYNPCREVALQFSIERVSVYATSRAIGATWTMEIEEQDPEEPFRKFWRASRNELREILGNNAFNHP